mgnify:FL=1
MQLNTNVWFPSIIWITDLPDLPDYEKNMMLEIKNYIQFIHEKDKDGRKISNFGGWQSKSFRSFPVELSKLKIILEKAVLSASDSIDLPKLMLQSMWFNINSYGDYNTKHIHGGSLISAVFYVDVPDNNMGNINFHRGDSADFFIPSDLKKYNNITCNKAAYEPISGRLILFPSWLEHSVDGCRSNKKRISIAFNYGLSK